MNCFFVKLKTEDEYIYVNPAHVVMFKKYNDLTEIFFYGDDDSISVVESPETVSALFEEYLKNQSELMT